MRRRAAEVGKEVKDESGQIDSYKTRIEWIGGERSHEKKGDAQPKKDKQRKSSCSENNKKVKSSLEWEFGCLLRSVG